MSDVANVETRFDSIDDAIEEIKSGRVVIVVDDADRENEGDFVMAAESVTPEAVNFMATHGRGIICMPCAGWRLEQEFRVGVVLAESLLRQRAILHGVAVGTPMRARVVVADVP